MSDNKHRSVTLDSQIDVDLSEYNFESPPRVVRTTVTVNAPKKTAKQKAEEETDVQFRNLDLGYTLRLAQESHEKQKLVISMLKSFADGDIEEIQVITKKRRQE